MADLARRLARLRVPLGFAAAAVTLLLAQPTWVSWRLGFFVAIAGEAMPIWAAGHLEKSREVTRTGPYRFTGHPLYVGSSVMAAGIVLAARSAVATIVVGVYMVATLTAAVRTEEAFLRRAFGPTYDEYRASRGEPIARRFSWTRAMRNREYRAAAGLAIGFALLALRIRVPL
jgi:protein-S-isoprenylcysteine O-methyltransferase Ste14